MTDTDFWAEAPAGRKILLYGEAGTGKTCALATLLEAGQKVRFLAAEKNAVDGVRTAMKLLEKRSKPEDFAKYRENIAVSLVLPPAQKLSDMIANVDKGLKTNLETLRKAPDAKRKNHTQFLNVLKGMSDFVDITGTSHGASTDWGTDVTLYIDGNTIICEGILKQVVGDKIAVSQPEWGVAQGYYKNFIRALTEQLTCNVVLLAHPIRVVDELTRQNRIYPSNLGQALNNWLPTAFSEVIWAYHEKGKFLWSTDDKVAVTRASSLPIASGLPADFRQIFT